MERENTGQAKPRILIVVDGGVCTTYAQGECEIVQVDFDVGSGAEADGICQDIDDRRASVIEGADYPFDDWAEQVWKEAQ